MIGDPNRDDDIKMRSFFKRLKMIPLAASGRVHLSGAADAEYGF